MRAYPWSKICVEGMFGAYVAKVTDQLAIDLDRDVVPVLSSKPELQTACCCTGIMSSAFLASFSMRSE